MAYGPHDDTASQRRASNSHNAPESVQPPLFTAHDPSTQPGLELSPLNGHDKELVNHVDEGDKEVFGLEVREVMQSDGMSSAQLIHPDQQKQDFEEPTRGRRICGLKRTVFWAALMAALFVVALAVGLGVGLTSRQSDNALSSSPTSEPTTSSTTEPSATPTASKELQIGGAIDSSYYSTSGAWNGSGIAYVWQNFTQHWDDILASNEYSHVVYFQDFKGELRWMRQAADYSWKEGPDDLVVVATDARNSTPISAAQYTADGVNHWNVFYIDSDNLVRQRSGNNRTVGWTEGSITKAKLTAWDGDLVGLSVCESVANESAPIRLFYASNSTAFEEYLWWAEDDNWEWQRTWEGYSASADVGCYTGSDDYRYVGLVNPSNQLEIWYQPAEDVPADWQKAQYEIPNVNPASSLVLTQDYAFYQEDATNAMKVAAVEWDNFYTSGGTNGVESPASALSGIAGTRMNAKQNGNYTWIFYQRSGRDVTWLEHAPSADEWQVKSPIPFT